VKARPTPTLGVLLSKRPAARRARAGVSLLEVLISIFVLSVGLLGIAAIIPVGGHEIAQATKADRAGACGHHGLQEVKVRRMLDPGSWLDVFWENAAPPTDWTGAISPSLSQSYAIDPLFVAQNPAVGADSNADTLRSIRRFPYAPPGYDFTAPDTRWYNRALTMRRVTLDQIEGTFDDTIPVPVKINWQRAVSARLFKWQDDLAIAVPGDESLRARQMMLLDTGQGRTSSAGAWVAATCF
jgi:hypothetical protein